MTIPNALPFSAIAADVSIGDLIFIRVPVRPFREVATATGSWTNHVGIVTDVAGGEPLVAESKFPLSRLSRLSAFVRRSEQGRFAVYRLRTPLTVQQRDQLQEAARRRLNRFYDTGFNLHSRRQFCSRYVREVLDEATGVALGDVQTFASLLCERPDTDLLFWKLWFFGRIPWNRETVSPASILLSPALLRVFDGYAMPEPRQRLPG